MCVLCVCFAYATKSHKRRHIVQMTRERIPLCAPLNNLTSCDRFLFSPSYFLGKNPCDTLCPHIFKQKDCLLFLLRKKTLIELVLKGGLNSASGPFWEKKKVTRVGPHISRTTTSYTIVQFWSIYILKKSLYTYILFCGGDIATRSWWPRQPGFVVVVVVVFVIVDPLWLKEHAN